MKRTTFFLLAFITILLAGCHDGSYTPKPTAYLRIDTPEPDYHTVDTLPLPFCFELNKAAKLVLKKESPRVIWADIEYPDWNGVVFLSYMNLRGLEDLRGQVDTSSRLLEKHYQFASGIDEKAYEDPTRGVFGSVYDLHGRDVASPCQFWCSDSSTHFLRGAFFPNCTPNNDSLAPIISYVRADIIHLFETLKWK